MKTVSVVCSACGKTVIKPKNEMNRRARLGSNRFYCNRQCAGAIQSEKKISRPEDSLTPRECQQCKKLFTPNWHRRYGATKFCSRECASSGSVTELRRSVCVEVGKRVFAASGLYGGPSQKSMLSREKWKYVRVEEYLNGINENHEFEFKLPGTKRFFDLALIDRRVLVEFDGPYHEYGMQKEDDEDKEKIAIANGWKVIRAYTPPSCVIDPACIMHICGSDTESV